MSTDDLRDLIDEKITTNGEQEITGAILNNVLQETVDTLADGENLDEGSIKTANIADGAITTDKIADGNVKTGKIEDGAVTKDKLGQNVSADLDWAVASNSYYRNSQAGDVAAKVITTYKNMNLIGGGSLKVTFENVNTADDATLNIDGKGAKPLYYNGARVSSTNSWEAGETVEIYYNNYTTGIYYAKRWMVEPVSVSQNSETGKTELKIGDDVALTFDDEIDSEVNNNPSTVGAVGKLVGKVSTVIKPSSGWYGSITGYLFPITADKDYLIVNKGNSKLYSIRLFSDISRSDQVEQLDVNIESGSQKIVTFSHNAVTVDCSFQDSDNKVVFYNAESYNKRLCDIEDVLSQVDDYPTQDSNNLVKSGGVDKAIKDSLNMVSVFKKATSGWYGSPTGNRFSIVANTDYVFINVCANQLTTIRTYDSENVQKEEKDLFLQAGQSVIVRFNYDAVRIDCFFVGTDNIVNILSAYSYDYKLLHKIDTSALVQNVGTDTTKIPSQATVLNNITSPFINCPTLLTGIQKFLLLRNSGGQQTSLYYKKYRVKEYYYNRSGFFMIMLVQGWDGTDWNYFDTIEILSADAPTTTDNIVKLQSKYGGFFVWIDKSKMVEGNSTSLDVEINRQSLDYFEREAYYDIDNIKNKSQVIDDYAIKDSTAHIIKVDASGNGDYTTIGDAYAAITDSNLWNQYEVVVYPGVYNETFLIPPIFTHTHGLKPNTVVVHNQGLESVGNGNTPVFDLQGHASKLSNMTIISYLGYCIHLDNSLAGAITICENLYLKKVYNNGADVRNLGWKPYTNPTIVGTGADFNGAKFIFKSCTFVDGWIGTHTNPNTDANANQTLVYDHCKLVNAIIDLQTLANPTYNTDGLFNCEIIGLKTQKGYPSVIMRIAASASGATIPNIAWQISGGNNENFAVTFDNQDTAGLNVDDWWDAVNSNEKSFVELANNVSATKLQLVDISGNICTSLTPLREVLGIVLKDTATNGIAPVWIGNAFSITLADGEYGIGSDGNLSSSATSKIGFVKNNIFYRY